MFAPGLPCPAGCGEYGTCNPLRGLCECPLTRVGPACQTLALPDCSIDGEPLRPTHLVHLWESRLASSRWLGPLTCGCVGQVVAMRNLLWYHNPWLAKNRHYAACAVLPGVDQSVGALLSAPASANWTTVIVRFSSLSTIDAALQPPPGSGSWFYVELDTPRGAPRRAPLPVRRASWLGNRPAKRNPTVPHVELRPLSDCHARCGLLGACVKTVSLDARQSTPQRGTLAHRGLARVNPEPSRVAHRDLVGHVPASCACFPPSRLDHDTCVPPRLVAMPPPPGRAPPLPRGDWQLSNPSSLNDGMRCPGKCSGVGACDYEGFCRCAAGRWVFM